MQIPHELIPMFISLSGARDRAKHEQKKVGNVYCRAATEITLVGIVSTPPSEAVANRVAILQKQAQLIIKHAITRWRTTSHPCWKMMVLQRSTMTHNRAYFWCRSYTSSVRTSSTPSNMTQKKAAEALSHVTADIVAGWQG